MLLKCQFSLPLLCYPILLISFSVALPCSHVTYSSCVIVSLMFFLLSLPTKNSLDNLTTSLNSCLRNSLDFVSLDDIEEADFKEVGALV